MNTKTNELDPLLDPDFTPPRTLAAEDLALPGDPEDVTTGESGDTGTDDERAASGTSASSPDAATVAAWQVQGNRRRALGIKTAPAQLWARWRLYCERRDKAEEFATLTGFALELGQFCGHLGHVAERGRQWAEVCEKVKLDAIERAERALPKTRFPAGLIFFLKNRAGFRERSPDEVKAAADWLDALASAAGERRARRLSSSDGIPLDIGDVTQATDGEGVASPDILDFPPKQVMS